MGKILGDEELNQLPSKIYYSYFDNKIENCGAVKFYDETEKRLRASQGLQEFSDKIMNALCYVYNQRKSFDSDKNICDFLYYWISDILLTYLTTTSSYNSVIGFLFDFFYITPGNKLCDVLHYGMDEEKNFEDIKLMFDYSKDYNAYEEQLTQDNPRCHENYNSYLKKYVDSYKKMQSECEGKKNSVKYCKYFEKYFLNKDPSRLSTLTCELEKTTEGTGRYVGQTQLEPTLGEKSGSEGQDRSSHSDSYSSSTRMSINPAPSTSSSSPIPSKSITAVASIAGFLVPSFLMYKFTPAGTWINKLLGRAPNLNHIPLRDSGIIEQFPNDGRFNTENDAFNISYSP